MGLGRGGRTEEIGKEVGGGGEEEEAFVLSEVVGTSKRRGGLLACSWHRPGRKKNETMEACLHLIPTYTPMTLAHINDRNNSNEKPSNIRLYGKQVTTSIGLLPAYHGGREGLLLG